MADPAGRMIGGTPATMAPEVSQSTQSLILEFCALVRVGGVDGNIWSQVRCVDLGPFSQFSKE